MLAFLVWIVSCGGTSPSSEVPEAPVVSTVPPVTVESIAEATPSPTPMEITPAKTVESKAISEPTATPKPVITPNPTAAPKKDSLPPVIKPAPTVTAKPRATATPTPQPTSTPTPTPQPTPTPTVMVQPTVYEDFNFSISLDDKVDITTTGWSEDSATQDQGVVYFPYKGVNAILIWMPAGSDTADTVLTNHYNLFTTSQPDNEFTIISEGEIAVGTETGAYGTFVAADSSGASTGGGIIGGWICSNSATSFGLTVTTDLDATTLQIRFSRLISSFGCSL